MATTSSGMLLVGLCILSRTKRPRAPSHKRDNREDDASL